LNKIFRGAKLYIFYIYIIFSNYFFYLWDLNYFHTVITFFFSNFFNLLNSHVIGMVIYVSIQDYSLCAVEFVMHVKIYP